MGLARKWRGDGERRRKEGIEIEIRRQQRRAHKVVVVVAVAGREGQAKEDEGVPDLPEASCSRAVLSAGEEAAWGVDP